MGKKIKKGTKGQISKFISRAKAIKKLDISLKDFRKLCILKGVFPREPTKKLSNNHKTYYHAKDITYLASDKLMDFFRQQKVYRRKLQKAIARRDKTRVRTLKENRPALDINHIVRERYPNFADALRDLEDPLTLLSLLARFPGHRLFKIAPEKIELAKMLVLMLKALIVKDKLLAKIFLSVKGVYYQIDLNGQKVTWLEPYAFVTTLPFDVDYKIMLSFTEFYQVLTKFVLFKLYNDKGLVYPPRLLPWEDPGTSLPEDASVFQNVRLESVGAAAEEEQKIDEEFKKNREVHRILHNSGKSNKELFKGFVFFLSREVQKDLFELCVRAFSGSVVFDGENFESAAFQGPAITHVITDRAMEQVRVLPNREYVQPQWICDSINFNLLLPVADYRPGQPLPPHLSPFVDDEKAGFVPERKKEILALQGEYVEESVAQTSESEQAEQSEPENEPAAKALNPKPRARGLKKAYKVTEEVFDADVAATKKKRQARKDERATEELRELMLTRKKQRLLSKIKNFDENKKEKVKKILERKKQLKKAAAKTK